MRISHVLIAAAVTLSFAGGVSATPLASSASPVRAESGVALAKWGHGRYAKRHWYKYRQGRRYEDYHQHWR